MLKSGGAPLFTAGLVHGPSSASTNSRRPPLRPNNGTSACASDSVSRSVSNPVSNYVSRSDSNKASRSVSKSVHSSVSRSGSTSISASACRGSDGGNSGVGGRARGGVGGGRSGSAGSACTHTRGGGAAGRSTKRRLPCAPPAAAAAAVPAPFPVRRSGGGRSGGRGAGFSTSLTPYTDEYLSRIAAIRPPATPVAAVASVAKRGGHGPACPGGGGASLSPSEEGWLAGRGYGGSTNLAPWPSPRGCHPKNFGADSSTSINTTGAGGALPGANAWGDCAGGGGRGGGGGGGVYSSWRASTNAGPCGFPPSLPRPVGGGGIVQEARAFAPTQHLAVLRALLDEDEAEQACGGGGSSGSESDSDS